MAVLLSFIHTYTGHDLYGQSSSAPTVNDVCFMVCWLQSRVLWLLITAEQQQQLCSIVNRSLLRQNQSCVTAKLAERRTGSLRRVLDGNDSAPLWAPPGCAGRPTCSVVGSFPRSLYILVKYFWVFRVRVSFWHLALVVQLIVWKAGLPWWLDFNPISSETPAWISI